MSTNNPLLSQYVAITQDGAIELAESNDGKFKRFRKMIAGYGAFVDPRPSAPVDPGTGEKKKMILDKTWADRIVDNFKNGPIKRIPVPLGHPQTSAELAALNKGWLIDAEAKEDGLYGVIEIRKQDTAEDIDNGVLVDTSVAFDEQYVDKKSGKVFRDVLKHVGLVNDPYIKDMTEFEPALSEGSLATILFSDSEANGNNENKEENTMGKVVNNRDFPVEVKYTLDNSETTATIEPGASLEVPDEQVDAVTKQVTDSVKADEELSEEQKKEQELADREAAVAKREAALSEKTAEAEFEKLLSEGKVVPAQKEAFIALSTQSDTAVELSDGVTKSVSTLLSEFLSKMPKGFKLSEEEGVSGGDKKEDDVELTSEEKSLTDFGLTEEDLKETKKQEGAK